MKRAPVTVIQPLAAILSLSVTLLACKPATDVEEVRQALPTATAMQVKVPSAAAAQAPVAPGEAIGSHSSALLGATAEFYMLTRGVSVELNGGAAWVLILVRTIVAFPVTSVEGDMYIWGPWTEALSPSEYRLTVTETVVGDFEWSLEGRKKADGPGAAFEAVVAGVATPGQPLRGSGAFMMDFETAERLDPAGNSGVGRLEVVYDLESEPRSIEMDYARPELNEQGVYEDATAHYEYREASDGSGDFVFRVRGDMDEDGSAWETIDIRSRWHATGAGRADVTISGGDLGDIVVDGTECWDESFARVYWTDTINIQPTEGDASACRF